MRLSLFCLILLVPGVQVAHAQLAVSIAKANDHERLAEQYAEPDSSRLALMHYQQAYRLVKDKVPLKAAHLCVKISSLYYGNGDFRSPILFCQQGLHQLSLSKTNADSTHFKLCTILGSMYKFQFVFDSSYVFFQKAEKILERNDSLEKQFPNYILHHYNNHGQLLLTLQDYNRSMLYFKKAQSIAIKYKKPDDLPYISSSIAECHDLLHNHQAALQYRKEALKYHPIPDLDHAAYQSGLAWTLLQIGNCEAAILTSRQTLKLLARLPDKASKFYWSIAVRQYWFIAACLHKQEKLQEADAKITHAIELYHTHFEAGNENLANLYLLKAQILLQTKDFNTAITYLQKVLQLTMLPKKTEHLTNTDVKSPKIAIMAAQYQSLAWQANYERSRTQANLTQALKAYTLAIRLKQISEKNIEDQHLRFFLAEQHFSLYPAALQIGYKAYHQSPHQFEIANLFDWFELFQSGYLNDAVRLRTIKKRTLPPHILDEEGRLERQLAALRSKPSIDTGLYTSLRIRQYQFKQQLLERYPTYYRSIYQSSPFRLSELQQKLDPQTAYLSYIWQNDCLYTMVVTHNHAEVICRPVTSKLQQCLTDLHRQLTHNPGFGQYKGTSSAVYCYQYFLEPLRKILYGKKNLVISRDPKFQFLPFEMLETGKKQNDFLVTQFAIAYTYSAQWYWQHPTQALSKKSSFLSDISYNAQKSNLIVAPFLPDTSVHAPWKPISGLKEVKKIGGEVLANTKATKVMFLNHISQKTVIHIATHTVVDSLNALNSYLQLYPNQDSRLYFDDICKLPLQQTSLVVLGACNADQGHIVNGEGVLSLARAFAYAGVRSVVTTTWEANNGATTLLSMNFHHYLQQGYRIDEALQKARLELIHSDEHREYKHPYYWSNYILVGNPAAVYPGHLLLLSRWRIEIAGTLLLLLGSMVWLRRSKITSWSSFFRKP